MRLILPSWRGSMYHVRTVGTDHTGECIGTMLADQASTVMDLTCDHSRVGCDRRPYTRG